MLKKNLQKVLALKKKIHRIMPFVNNPLLTNGNEANCYYQH